MSTVGTEGNPLRVAIVGSGPAGFYAAEHLLKDKELVVGLDMFDRLPTPFGLVRFGVAPDHQKIKKVTKVFDRVASDGRFRFFGNVDVGTDVTLQDLSDHYHQICYATGAQTDRRMGIPGEDLTGSRPATEFVAWYNGHPEFRDYQFDLTAERVAVVGVGNVAVDVARILCRTTEELAATDIADYALDALSQSRVKEVIMLGRRGPAQAAFTNQEVKQLGVLPGADIDVRAEEARLDALSAAEVERAGDRTLNKKLEIIQSLAASEPTGKSRKLTIRFLVSPVELIGNDAGAVIGMRLVRNVLVMSVNGGLRPEATDEFEEIPVELVFRSVGYRGVALPALPFDERSGTVPNERGSVVRADGTPMVGVYVTGWIKRGPTGVIGTNKPDAVETVNRMREDMAQNRVFRPTDPTASGADELVRSRRPDHVSYADWRKLDALEIANGKPNRPRVKFTAVDEMLNALRK